MAIHVNQCGYLPSHKKTAVLTAPAEEFWLVDSASGERVYSGAVTYGGADEASGDDVSIADFSDFAAEGRYRVVTSSGEQSYNFNISAAAYKAVKIDMLRALYYQRCGCALEEKHAGVYTHAECHKDLSAILYNEDVLVDMTGGWHDAGDYGRYITPAATTVAHLLYAYELFPSKISDDMNIPESGNGVPDVLNECRYELEWMLKMQEKTSGGVYHKLTTYYHAPFVMPEHDKERMLAYPISSLATGAFAACMALCYRVYKKYDAVFADKMLAAAKEAWRWLIANPHFVGAPENPKGGNTGIYGDKSDKDERFWAAAELYRATGDELYHKVFADFAHQNFAKAEFGWVNVSAFASVSYVFNPSDVADERLREYLRGELIAKADKVYAVHLADKYGNSITPAEYCWGSNMVVANHAMNFVIAAILTSDKKYEEAAIAQIDYLLGKNAMGISYVTGHGENAYRNPHLRTTFADGIDDPMPGWVSGGPNSRPSDDTAMYLIKKGTPPAKCYIDRWECYSLNEMTIYWNSPVIFAAAYFDK